MISLIRAKTGKQLADVKKLYLRAFPAYERKPFPMLRYCPQTEIFRCEENGEFCGLAIVTVKNDVALIEYFAVSEDRRGKGTGSGMLKALVKKYADMRVILEIETTLKDFPDSETRLRRKKFYLRCGFSPEDYTVGFFGSDMELLTYGGKRVAFEEYRSVYGFLGNKIRKNGGNSK